MTGEGETNIIMCCQSPGLEMDSVSVCTVRMLIYGRRQIKSARIVFCPAASLHTHASDTSDGEVTGGV